MRRQSLPLGVGAIAEFLRSIIYGTLIVHRLIRCKTSCQSTSPCSFTAVTPPAPGLMAGDADGQGDWNQYSPSRFPLARHSSTGSARAEAFPAPAAGAPRRSVPCSWMRSSEVRPGLAARCSCWCSDRLFKELSVAVLIFPALVYPSNYKIRRSRSICVRQPSVSFGIIRKTTDCSSIQTKC